MAILRKLKDEEEVKALTIAALRREYNFLATEHSKMLDGEWIYCPRCGDWKSANNFYSSEDSADKINHYACKKCCLLEATDFDTKTQKYIDNKEKTILTLQHLDLPFVDKVYENAVSTVGSDVGEKVRSSAWLHYITMIRSLSQYKYKHFNDSEFMNESDAESANSRKPKRVTTKRFGGDWPVSDLLYLEDQYEDWVARTQIDSKSQEMYVTQICLQTLDIDKDRKAGKDVSTKLKALDTLMNAANLQPKQNVNNAATDSLTFGQLIEKWENEKPIPEPSEEFKDVDGIGKYIRVWFAGWLSKAVGLKNSAYTKECEDYIKQYTVHKPEFNNEENSNLGDDIDSLFSNGEEEE